MEQKLRLVTKSAEKNPKIFEGMQKHFRTIDSQPLRR